MKKKIALDMLLNILATAIPTIVLQLLILPAMAKQMIDENYGLLVTYISLFNIVPAMMGNVINNIRLIHGEQEDNKATSDYKVLLIILTLINLIVMIVFTICYDKKMSFGTLLLVLIISILWLSREYYLVAFRIQLNFFAIVLSNVFLVIGYGLGYILFVFTKQWQFVYIVGLGVSLIYICIKSDLWKEPIKKSKRFGYISKETFFFLISNLLLRIIEYADKLLIFPVLGGVAVSIYYVATVLGKVISMAMTPLSSVILSYLSKKGLKNNRIFVKLLLGSSGICIMGYIVCIIVSRPVLKMIYPQYVESVMPFIFLTTGTAVLSAMIAIVNPFVLKYLEMKWQIFINGLMVCVYIVVCRVLMQVFGLYGFCIGAVIAYSFRLILLLWIYKKYIAIKVGKTNGEDNI